MPQVRLAIIKRFVWIIEEESWIEVSSIDDAILKVKEFSENECFEDWKFLGGDLRTNTGKIIAIIRENGSISGVKDTGNDCYEFLPDDTQLSHEEVEALMIKYS